MYEKINNIKNNPQAFYGELDNILEFLKNNIETFNSAENLLKFSQWYRREDFPDSKRYWIQINQILSVIRKDYNYHWLRADENKVNYQFSEYEKKYILKLKNEIILYSLIKLLWIGTKKEKFDAIKYLQENTGEKLYTAKEWNNWWRKEYYPEIFYIHE
ncbi:hypothetical protein ACFL4T_14505 [candidate division KSB1 bacterium]